MSGFIQDLYDRVQQFFEDEGAIAPNKRLTILLSLTQEARNGMETLKEHFRLDDDAALIRLALRDLHIRYEDECPRVDPAQVELPL